MAKLESISTGFNTPSRTVVRPGGGGQSYFTSFDVSSGFSSLQFAHTFSCQLDCVRRVDYAVEDGVGHSRVTHHVVPARGRILGGDDDRFALVAVFDDVEQDRTLLRVKGHPEKDHQG